MKQTGICIIAKLSEMAALVRPKLPMVAKLRVLQPSLSYGIQHVTPLLGPKPTQAKYFFMISLNSLDLIGDEEASTNHHWPPKRHRSFRHSATFVCDVAHTCQRHPVLDDSSETNTLQAPWPLPACPCNPSDMAMVNPLPRPMSHG